MKKNYLINPVTFKVNPKDRIWIRGKNGCGKSSLIKLLIGEDINYTGCIDKAKNISYVSQDTFYLKGKIEEFFKERGIE